MNIILDHIVLNVQDVERSVEFYTRVLQCEAERLDQFRSGMVPFPSVRLNRDTIIDLFPPEMGKFDQGAANRNNLNHFCIALDRDDWEKLRVRLKDREIKLFRDGSVNFGAKGDGISMYFRDPDGNEIEARYYENR